MGPVLGKVRFPFLDAAVYGRAAVLETGHPDFGGCCTSAPDEVDQQRALGPGNPKEPVLDRRIGRRPSCPCQGWSAFTELRNGVRRVDRSQSPRVTVRRRSVGSLGVLVHRNSRSDGQWSNLARFKMRCSW